MMNSKISFWALLKPLSKPSCAPSAVCAKGKRSRSGRGVIKVCHRLTWRMTYLKRPVRRCMSPSCWLASRPVLASRWIAKVWSPRSPRKWRGEIASCALTKIPLPCVRRPDDPAGRAAGDPVGMAGGFSPAAQLEEGRAAGRGLSGLLGPTHLVADPVEQWWPAAQLEQRVLSALALWLGAAAVVCPDPAAWTRAVSGAAGGGGGR